MDRAPENALGRADCLIPPASGRHSKSNSEESTKNGSWKLPSDIRIRLIKLIISNKSTSPTTSVCITLMFISLTAHSAAQLHAIILRWRLGRENLAVLAVQTSRSRKVSTDRVKLLGDSPRGRGTTREIGMWNPLFFATRACLRCPSVSVQCDIFRLR